MKSKAVLVILLSLIAAVPLWGAEPGAVKTQQEADALVQSLKFREGTIDLDNGMATVKLNDDFRFLNADDTKKVLEKIWGNPPAKQPFLGMIMPADRTPLDVNGWAVTITYADDGYVKDDDANTINYDNLLKQIQSAVKEGNKTRAEQGYATVELLGWATPPRYDSASHKLYWAKELKFSNSEKHGLNYDIRILGRHGVLVLSAVAAMQDLPEIEKSTPQILSLVNFNPGHRYADFDPKIDKVAAYGLAALVAGGVAAKLGLFKVLLGVLLAAKKFVIIAFAAVAAWFKKLFGKGKSAKQDQPPVT